MDTAAKHYITSQKELLTRCRELEYPVYLQLPNDEEICFTKALRVIPKKRLTAQGLWHDKEIIVKLFFSPRKAKHYADRDQSGIAALMQENIPTPNLLYAGSAAIKGLELLVFEYLDNAENFTALWKQAITPAQQLKRLVKILYVVAKQHKAGLIQEDLHLGNFMMRQARVYSLDGDALKRVTHSRKGVAAKKSLQNVALLIAQLSYVHNVNVEQAYFIYARFRRWSFSKRQSNLFQTYVHKKLLRLRRKFLEKTLRECSSFATAKSITMRAVWAREQGKKGLSELLPSIEQQIQTQNTPELAKLLLAETPVLVRKYQVKRWVDRVKYALQCSSPVKQEWLNAHCLQLIGASTLKPLAMCEKGVYPYFPHGYLVSEYIEGIRLDHYVEQHKDDAAELARVFKYVGLNLQKLAQSHITYGNMQAENFLVTDKNIVLVALDKVEQHSSLKTFHQASAMDIQAFIQNWQTEPTIQALVKTTFENLQLT